MSEAQKNTTEATNSRKMLVTMVGIGTICALLIVLSFQTTLPRIEKLKAEALEKAIFKVIPGMVSKKTFQLEGDKLKEVTGKVKDAKLVYAGFDKDGKLVGLAIEASGMGFADAIKVIYGYDPHKEKIVGFYVLESKETPGLGDKIEKDASFLANFDSLDVALSEDKNSVKNPVTTVKHGKKKNGYEVDGITGATISSRAVGNLLKNSTGETLPQLYKNKDFFEAKSQQ
ncbi:MAG: RnfABCDGE type electron transport complex subunit G [Saprospiraceae bacterium]|nr:RnfABCDGE type electron transport complex subunit G [Saprospiraceae bacterium]